MPISAQRRLLFFFCFPSGIWAVCTSKRSEKKTRPYRPFAATKLPIIWIWISDELSIKQSIQRVFFFFLKYAHLLLLASLHSCYSRLTPFFSMNLLWINSKFLFESFFALLLPLFFPITHRTLLISSIRIATTAANPSCSGSFNSEWHGCG